METDASATIVAPVSGALSCALTRTDHGNGYNTLTTITLSGGGNSGTITGFLIFNQGSEYTSIPTITITGGSGTGAKATVDIPSWKVVGIALINGGSSYNTTPTIPFSGGGGSSAVATPALTLGTRAILTAAFTRIFHYI